MALLEARQRASVKIDVPKGTGIEITVGGREVPPPSITPITGSSPFIVRRGGVHPLAQNMGNAPAVDEVARAREFVVGRSVRPGITPDRKDREVTAADKLSLFVKKYGPYLVQGASGEDFDDVQRIELNNDANRGFTTVVQALFEERTSRGEANQAGVHGFSLREGIASDEDKRTLGLEAVDEIGRRLDGLFTIGIEPDAVFLSPPPEYTADLQPR